MMLCDLLMSNSFGYHWTLAVHCVSGAVYFCVHQLSVWMGVSLMEVCVCVWHLL